MVDEGQSAGFDMSRHTLKQGQLTMSMAGG